jgi:hypothetical protein
MSQEDIRAEISPGHLMDLATRHSPLRAALAFWRQGQLTWDQAMAYAVVLLCAQVEAVRSDDAHASAFRD